MVSGCKCELEFEESGHSGLMAYAFSDFPPALGVEFSALPGLPRHSACELVSRLPPSYPPF